MFSLFEHKTDLLQLLDISSRAQGVQIYIGGDSQLLPMEEVSVITAHYGVDGRVIGTLGVIGPTRMAYERVIPIVDITRSAEGRGGKGGDSQCRSRWVPDN